MDNTKTAYKNIIQGQITTLESLHKKKEALLAKQIKENKLLEEKVLQLEKENKKYSQQKIANSILESNIPEHEKKALLAQIEKYIKVIDASIEKLNNSVAE